MVKKRGPGQRNNPRLSALICGYIVPEIVMAEEDQKNKILDWMEERIGGSDNFFIPLKKLRNELEKGLSFPIPPVGKLLQWLEQDSRFDIFPMPENLGGVPAGDEAEMEKMGFYRGPRIGLKSKKPTAEQIAEKLGRHADKLINSLTKAYASRPREGTDTGMIEDRLLELLQKAQDFKNKLPSIITEEKK